LPRQDALKVLPKSLSADIEFRKRFLREADLAATLFHPHIVRVHDRGEYDDQLWISMDYIDGTDAAQFVRDRYPAGMPADEALAIVVAVADALDYAHECGLLHRDVKPANILLSQPDGEGQRRIFLADFGIARPLADPSGLTATNLTVGTVAYAAPEQLMGEAIDRRTDQYALAATAFHLLSGAPIFDHSNPVAVIGKHLTEPPPKLSSRRGDLHRLDGVLSTALSKSPSQRYPSCREFARALSEHIDSDSMSAGRPTHAAIPVASPVLLKREAETNATASRKVGLRTALLTILSLVAAVAIAATVMHFTENNPSPSSGPATSSVAPPPPLAAPPPAATTPASPVVTPAPTLESLLLSPERINAIMGVSGLGLQDTYSDTGRLNEGGQDDILSFTPMNCLGAAFGPMEPDYGDSGYTEVQGREMTETDGSYHHWVDQAVVSFRSASDASAFLAKTRDEWRDCSGKLLELTRAGNRYEQWKFGDVNTSGDVISIYKTAVSTRPWACSHARGVKANIVADSFACGEGTVTNQPTTIVNHILAKVPKS
jgi:serine/threonine protein kinase